MDGKTGAEELIAKVLTDPALLQSLAAGQAQAARADRTANLNRSTSDG